MINRGDIRPGVITNSHISKQAGLSPSKLAKAPGPDYHLKSNASGEYVHTAFVTTSDVADLATVATSGDYNDLINKPGLLSGDVSSDSDNVTTIGTGKVTFDKIQNVDVDKIIGRNTVGSGDVEALTPDEVTTMLALVVADITDLTATAAELNKLDGATVSTAELNYVTGVTSSIQTQLDGKSAVGHTHTLSDVTDVTSTAAELNKLDGATVSTAEINLLSGMTALLLTGDVTSTTAGVTTIANNAVETAMILDDNVTLPKLADIATNSFLGRNTAGTGTVEVLSAATARSVLNVADGANNYSHPNHTGDVTSVGDGATTIASNAVTTAKINDEAVTLAKLAHIATDSFLGRDTATTGDVEVLSAATARTVLNVADGANNYSHPNHTGDVTSVGDGATTIASNAVVTAKIADEAVTLAKLAHIATDSFLGRDTATTGDVEVLSAATARTVLNVADGANNYSHPNHTGDVTSVGDGATTIANNAVTLAKFQDIATDSFLGRDTTGTGDPEVLSAATARTILNVADGANAYSHPNHTGDVTSVGDGATTIASNAVVTAKIADEAVTLAKLAHIATDSFLGRDTASTGDVEVLSAATARSVLNVADGANAYSHPNHSGDVTSVGDGATTIANNAVTLAKFQDIATNSFLGRDTAGTGDPEVLSAATAKSVLAITAADITDVTATAAELNIMDGVTATTAELNIMDGVSATTMEINLLSGMTSLLLSGDVVSTTAGVATIQSNAVETSMILDNNVTVSKLAQIATDSFLGRDTAATGNVEVLSAATARSVLNVADGANNYSHPNHTGDVTSTGDGATSIASNAVVTAKIADEAVTLAKLAHMATDSFLGRDTAGTGDVEVLNAATARSILNVEDGATADQTAAEIRTLIGSGKPDGTAPTAVSGDDGKYIYYDHATVTLKWGTPSGSGTINNTDITATGTYDLAAYSAASTIGRAGQLTYDYVNDYLALDLSVNVNTATDTTDATYTFYVNGGIHSNNKVKGTRFEDVDDTTYYTEPGAGLTNRCFYGNGYIGLNGHTNGSPPSATVTDEAMLYAEKNGSGDALLWAKDENDNAHNLTPVSDYRVKSGIRKYDDSKAIQLLRSIRVCEYNRVGARPGTPLEVGFVAHEVQEGGLDFNDVIKGKKDATRPDGRPRHQGIDNRGMIPLIWAALRDMDSRVGALEAN